MGGFLSRLWWAPSLLVAVSVSLACVPSSAPEEGKRPAAIPAAPTPTPRPLPIPTPVAIVEPTPTPTATPTPTHTPTPAPRPTSSPIPRPTSTPAPRVSEEVRAEVVAEGLEIPWELAFPPDGRILVTERPGRIRVIRKGLLQQAPWATLKVASISESGLMGMTLHPQFATNGFVFVCYTYRDSAGRLANRVARLTDRDGVGVEHRVILDGIPGAPIHDGCRLGFGPDGKLYVAMGDASDSRQAQNLSSLSGKVLRLEADGSVPADNPFPGSHVYTYGHRNPQGLAWHPATGDLFITEHGPDTNDEVNILQPGGNYGWPDILGVVNNPRFQDPILTFTPTIAPAGAAFYSGQRLPTSWEGNFLFANLKASYLHRVVLKPPLFRTVVAQQRLFQGQFGRLRAVAMAPDGDLYFTTSNRDGRGTPRPGDDKVLRLVPAPASAPGEFYPDPDGRFSSSLAPGPYQLRWTAPGFLATQRRVVVSSGEGIDLGMVTPRAGDLDGDGAVDGANLAALQHTFRQPKTPATTADLNADGVVDVLDLALLASNWGRRE